MEEVFGGLSGEFLGRGWSEEEVFPGLARRSGPGQWQRIRRRDVAKLVGGKWHRKCLAGDSEIHGLEEARSHSRGDPAEAWAGHLDWNQFL